ncbi:pyridoxamine 5'-phosphate oxidase family protein [Saccharicrinis sp. FJH62]|uniref:pyridoxamine 5'-phosphate oxidase family protein n=1 Tax=Saccharicrinis sp. FJH62 TaxID=3344657 RepID=UPI0035D3E986
MERILKNGKYAIISMCREDEPYIVTLSYGHDPEKQSLYFHCAPKGLKLDFLNANNRVCATVIEDGGYIINECGHEYKSVVFWGDMQIIGDVEEKKHGMRVLLHHLETTDSVMKEKLLRCDDFYAQMEILRLDIKQIHGKAGR